MNDLPDKDLIAAAEGAFGPGFGAVLRIDPGASAAFFVDGRGETCVVTEAQPAPPSATWRSGRDTLMSVFQRKRALENAYLSGRLQIAGDMSVMARLVLKGR